MIKIELKGKDGSIQIERKISQRSDGIVYKIYYKNDDIFFSSKEINVEGFDFKTLYYDLQRILNDSPVVTKIFTQEKKYGLKKLLQKVKFFHSKTIINKDFNKCSFGSLWPYGDIFVLDIERVNETSDFLINFTFFYDDVNYIKNDDTSDIKMKGFFVISKEALAQFNHALYQFIE